MTRRHIENSPIKYRNAQINSTQCTDFLGVMLDLTLSWKGHISKTIKKLNSACFAIRSLKVFLTINDLKLYILLMSTLLSHMELPFWRMAPIAKMFL
jgi:hypothetical protein